MSSDKSRDVRLRNYATVVYPESAPENWKELLSEQFVPAFISPLHDSDINPNGEPKKPHFHVMTMYDGKKSIDQARDVFDLIGGVGCEPVKSIRGYARYLCHLDNPEKFQYDPSDVICLCGADYISTIGLSIDKYKSIAEMIDYVSENDIFAYSDLLEYARRERLDWFRILCDCGTMVMKEYIKSRSWKSHFISSGEDDSSVDDLVELD